MSWSCPYLDRDGSCKLRNQDCKPLEKGCIILANDKYKRLYNKNDNQISGAKSDHPPTEQKRTS